MKIREMTIEDYDSLMALWRSTPGVSFRDADSREGTARYLARNPGMSFVAVVEGAIVGCVMSGHDGRRGYLQHLVVSEACRDQGLGEQLFIACLDALQAVGIAKAHIFVFRTNNLANRFWARKGWQLREDINMYSWNSSDSANA